MNVIKIIETLMLLLNFLNRKNIVRSEKLKNKLNTNRIIQKIDIIFNL
jgi:hypothetical protein